MAKYYDVDGNPKTLYTLVRDDPGWATSIIKHLEAEKEAQSCEVTKYREWFKENATNLAVHRIGGYEFVDFPDPVSEERKPYKGKPKLKKLETGPYDEVYEKGIKWLDENG